MRQIDELHMGCPFYGSRRLAGTLQVNRKRMQRLMSIIGIEALYPKRNLSRRDPDHEVHPYLLRDVTVDRADQVWSTDITYIPMQGGFLYLAAVMDWYSRYVLSWEISNTHGGPVLRGRPPIGLRLGLPGNLQHRSRLAIHLGGLPGTAKGAKDTDQHGWPRTLSRQRLHRAAMEIAQIRTDIPRRFRLGPRPLACARGVLRLLQPEAAAPSIRIQDASRLIYFSHKANIVLITQDLTIPHLWIYRFLTRMECRPPRTGHNWSIIEMLDRRIGQRRDATRGPSQVRDGMAVSSRIPLM